MFSCSVSHLLSSLVFLSVCVLTQTWQNTEAATWDTLDTCIPLMPKANCPNRCVPSRTVPGKEDCSRCTLYRFMPPATCTQCSPERPCNTCFALRLMPVNEHRTVNTIEASTEYPSTTEPMVTPAPTESIVTPAPTEPIVTPAPTESIVTPVPTEPIVTPAPPIEAATLPPTYAPSMSPATVAPTYAPSPAPATVAPTYAPSPRSPPSAAPVTKAPSTSVPFTNAPIATAPNTYGTNANANAATGTSLSAGAIVGIVLGCLFAIGLVMFVVIKRVRDNKSREEQMFGEAAELENPDSSSNYAAM